MARHARPDDSRSRLMVGLVAARFEQDADANPVPVAWLDAQDLAGPRSAEECGAAPLYLRVARLIERPSMSFHRR